mmetsp:Transcript_5973/g.15663  ORF Transcript_5973/g.15663 Transcript_5973/m.15663 type:complete len:262 (+) Transcript_5973:926-1711(+)
MCVDSLRADCETAESAKTSRNISCRCTSERICLRVTLTAYTQPSTRLRHLKTVPKEPSPICASCSKSSTYREPLPLSDSPGKVSAHPCLPTAGLKGFILRCEGDCAPSGSRRTTAAGERTGESKTGLWQLSPSKEIEPGYGNGDFGRRMAKHPSLLTRCGVGISPPDGWLFVQESGSVELSSHSRTGESTSCARPCSSNSNETLACSWTVAGVGRLAMCWQQSGLVGESSSIARFGVGVWSPILSNRARAGEAVTRTRRRA